MLMADEHLAFHVGQKNLTSVFGPPWEREQLFSGQMTVGSCGYLSAPSTVPVHQNDAGWWAQYGQSLPPSLAWSAVDVQLNDEVM